MLRATVLIAACLLACSVAAESLSPVEQRMADWIDAHQEEAVALLKASVDIPSGSLNMSGVRQVGDLMRRELDDVGLENRMDRYAG